MVYIITPLVVCKIIIIANIFKFLFFMLSLKMINIKIILLLVLCVYIIYIYIYFQKLNLTLYKILVWIACIVDLFIGFFFFEIIHLFIYVFNELHYTYI